MAFKIKNWEKFQHYKTRNPLWIKLYRDLLDDIEWHNLSGDASKVLAMLWLVASEKNGCLPDKKKLCFRLRISESKLNNSLSELSHWVENDASDVLASSYQNACIDKSKRREEKSKSTAFESEFENAWKQYPRQLGKKDAFKHFNASVVTPDDLQRLMVALDKYKAHVKDKDPNYIQHGSTWFNNWQDWVNFKNGGKDDKPTYKPPVAGRVIYDSTKTGE